MRFDDLHPGIAEWLAHANGWPRHWLTVRDMPAEDAAVLRYMLATEAAQRESEAALEVAKAFEALNMQRLLKQSGMA